MERYCPQCEGVGYPIRHTSGSFFVEVVLWLFFCAPGIVYTIWRHTSARSVCPACGAPNMVPLSSPRARGAVIPPAAPWARDLAEAARSENPRNIVIAAIAIVVAIALFAVILWPHSSPVPAAAIPSDVASDISLDNNTATLISDTHGNFKAAELALPAAIHQAGYTYRSGTDLIGLPAHFGTHVGAAHLTKRTVEVSATELIDSGIRLVIAVKSYARPTGSARWTRVQPDSAACRELLQIIDTAIHH